LPVVKPTSAQDGTTPSGQTTTPNDTTTPDSTVRSDYNRDNNFSWGWLGLIGLAGLAGLNGRKPNDNPARYVDPAVTSATSRSDFR